MAAPEPLSSQPRPNTRPPPAVNFSRPRPATPSKKLHHDNTSYASHVKSFEAFYEPQSGPLPVELPAELPPAQSTIPRSLVELPADVPVRPAAVELPAEIPATQSLQGKVVDPIPSYDRDGLPPLNRPHEYESSQRYVPPTRSVTSSSTATSTTTTASDQPGLTATTSSTTALLDQRPQILRRVSVTQTSERLSVLSTNTDDDSLRITPVTEPSAASSSSSSLPPPPRPPPPTPSSTTSSGSGSGGEKWTSSNYDTSGLSKAQIAKLTRKGINPALYAEMKAARKGRGKMSPLVGNTFLG